MATIAELEAAYEAVTRVTPSAAQKLILSDLAVASQNGVITDEQAYGHILKQADGTTTVAALTYQFFTGKLPTEAGFDYLVSSTANTSDLNDAYFQGFNFENRFINFAVSLGVHGEGKTAFQTKYGALSMRETAEVLYNQIIGVSQAQAAGIDVEAAIGGIVARANYFASIVYPPAAPGAPTPIHDGLAVKAAMAGYIMAEAVKAKVGVYSNGVSNFYQAVIDGEATFNTDLNDYVTSGGGSGGPGIPGNTVALLNDADFTVANGKFSDNNDTATGNVSAIIRNVVMETGNGGDRIGSLDAFVEIGTVGGFTQMIDLGGGNDAAFLELTSAADGGDITIDGGAGADILHLLLDTNVDTLTSVENFETVVLTSSDDNYVIDGEIFEGLKSLTFAGHANRSIRVTDLDSDVAVTIASTGTASMEFTSEDATIILGVSELGEIFAEGDLEDTLTVIAKGATTTDRIQTTASKIVFKGDYSLRTGVEFSGDEGEVDLSAISKDVSLTYLMQQETTNTIRMGGGDDLLNIAFVSDRATTITLGAGADVVGIDADSNSAIGGFDASGALKILTRIMDFDPDEDAIELGSQDGYHALSAAFFIGVAETDEARFAKVQTELAGQNSFTFTAFDAADGSGVFIYGNDTAANTGNDWYVKLVGVSLSDLRIDDDSVTGR